MQKKSTKGLQETIDIYGAREHNLKNVTLQIPRNELIVFTGLSGSGKSSLAFDTIFAEGQRRYIDTFSSYVKQFIGGLERPDVDKIDGLSPVISIEQKTVSRSPRSTVGTITELYDFFRLLFARIGTAYSYVTNEPMVKYSDDAICQRIEKDFHGRKVAFLAPKIKGRKGHYRELFEQILRNGYTKVRVDGEIKEIVKGMKLDRYKIHDIEVVVDRMLIGQVDEKRVYDSVLIAMKMGESAMMVMDLEADTVKHYSRSLMCPTSGISYPEPEPSLFSFNSPYGACPCCKGLGEVSEIDIDKIIPNPSLSIRKGGFAPLGEYKRIWIFEKMESILLKQGYSINTPIADLDEELIQLFLYGNEDMEMNTKSNEDRFEGIANFMSRHSEDSSAGIQRWAQGFMNKKMCPDCHGTRIRKEALQFKLNNQTIGDIAFMDFEQLDRWANEIEAHLNSDQKLIGAEILKEIRTRIRFILEVGLDYLTLHRSAKSLSGGEAQRIRLATQIGTELINVLYVLDEPSIGLHQRDNTKLIQSLKRLRDVGNSVLVVEHDKEMIEAADFIVDIGPGAGSFGGNIVSAGDLQSVLSSNSLTAQYLNGRRKIEVPEKRRKGNGNQLTLKGANGHNLKNVQFSIPLGTFTCVTGVSGSGKSSLINQTLYPLLMNHFYQDIRKPLEYKSIEGLEHLDKVIEIDQSPIGRTPRSNPVTYTKVFDEIRSLFAALPESQIRGYKAGRFSFNVAGGKCETCNGGGLKLIEMNFLPDVYVECETCNGKRYNPETLEVRYKGKNISDVLNMTIEESVPFFENHPKIFRILSTLQQVGLGYIKLGQSSTTLSGGEAQRIKLATELAKKATGKTIYILDEPSTGLHFEDIRMLLDVLQRLVNEGNTVLVIEHNMDIIKIADHIIDLGPEGGFRGGTILFNGTPEQMVKKAQAKSHTAKYLAPELTK
ncbi:MAG: excinuclease ABC subunit UvrA [Crocinitomicaceae bacterium]|jgi:excinuclease ABC subunit A|nr:excinuclease ABC subunit UvrA [Crocinitomicaceae bacterium]